MNSAESDATAWRIVVILSIVEAGAYVGTETARYFWDLTAYVAALDTAFPWRFEDPYPFLYPPFAKDLFTLARSHLFELLSIAYVAAAAFFLTTFAQLNTPRRFEWLFAITAVEPGALALRTLAGPAALLALVGHTSSTFLRGGLHSARHHEHQAPRAPLAGHPIVIGVCCLWAIIVEWRLRGH